MAIPSRRGLLTGMPAKDVSDVENLVIIDETHLASFSDGDRELEDEIADLFISTARGYLRRMSEAVKEERAWSAEVHALKGAGANFGACRVAALAKHSEFMPPSDDQVHALKKAIDDVAMFFANRQP